MTDIEFLQLKLQDEYTDIISLIKSDKEKGIENKIIIGKSEAIRNMLFLIDQLVSEGWNKEAIIKNYLEKRERDALPHSTLSDK